MPYRDPKRVAECQRRSHERNQAYIRQVKDRPCTDCGTKYPSYVMQFDHVPERGKKKFGLSSGRVYTRSIKSIQAEIDKCDVVCANCHAERTHQRMRP